MWIRGYVDKSYVDSEAIEKYDRNRPGEEDSEPDTKSLSEGNIHRVDRGSQQWLKRWYMVSRYRTSVLFPIIFLSSSHLLLSEEQYVLFSVASVFRMTDLVIFSPNCCGRYV